MNGGLYDYFIGDPVVTPPEHQPDFHEVIARLPHSYQINNRDQAVEPAPARAEVGLPDQGVVFACFCSADKLERPVFRHWMEILRSCPGSVLWLLEASPLQRSNLREEARAQGVDPGRLVFAKAIAKPAHLARLSLADIHLDTGTMGAHTTGSDALWAGVPLITRLGEAMAGRVGASLLHAVGLPELVAADWQAYTRLAIELARTPDRLAALKAKLAGNRLSTPLFDTERSVRDMERLYEAMWQRFSSGGSPAPIDVKP
jgi:predicted O-linked N-acetylglucosamine transferase (SPINDLY family)